MKRKERGFFKELILAWKNSDSPHMGFGGLGAVAIWFTSLIIAYLAKNFFGWNINLSYIFILVYFLLISLAYFMIEKKWRKTILVRSFLFMAIFLALLFLVASVIFDYLGINI